MEPTLALVREMAARSRAEALLDLSEAETDTLMRLLTRVHDNLSEREPTGRAAPDSADQHGKMGDDCIQ